METKVELGSRGIMEEFLFQRGQLKKLDIWPSEIRLWWRQHLNMSNAESEYNVELQLSNSYCIRVTHPYLARLPDTFIQRQPAEILRLGCRGLVL